MASDWITLAIEALAQSEIPAARGYPGTKMPYLTQAVAAVCIEAAYERTEELMVHLFSPMAAGGAACEDVALKALEAMTGIGGLCYLHSCVFDPDMGLFHQKLQVQLPGIDSTEDTQ